MARIPAELFKTALWIRQSLSTITAACENEISSLSIELVYS